jgi:hypothetical protein
MASSAPPGWTCTKLRVGTYETSLTLQLHKAIHDVVFANVTHTLADDWFLTIDGLNDNFATTFDASGNRSHFQFAKYGYGADSVLVFLDEYKNKPGRTFSELKLQFLNFNGTIATAPGTRLGIELELWSYTRP